MNILLVTESYWPNADGGAMFERRLALGMANRGHTLHVWAPGNSLRAYDETDGNTTISREPAITLLINRKYKLSIFPFIKARKMILTQKPTLIHIHNCYWMGLFTMFWARHYKIPVVATNHFMPENLLLNLTLPAIVARHVERLTWSYLTWFHNRAQSVISPTATAVKLLVDHGLRAPSVAISNGVDTNEFYPNGDTTHVVEKYHLATDRPRLLYVGRLDGEKRIDLIISAMPKILNVKAVQLIIAGYGNVEHALKAQTQRLNLEDDIVFTGYVSEADKPHLYNAANIFIIASPAELQSIVMLEAMASGLPVVAVNVAALKELCHDGENGFLFERDSTEALVAAVAPLITSQQLREQFGAESLRIIDSLHGSKAMLDAHETVYKRTVRLRGKMAT